MKNSPFPGQCTEHTGCLLCDSLLNQTIISFLQKPKKTPEEMNEEEKAVYEEKRKKKEEKLKLKEERKKNKAVTASAGQEKKEGKAKKPKKPKNAGLNQMTQQEIMNEFMKKQMGI